MKFKLFPARDRSTKICYFCGTNKSVKYHSKIKQRNGEEIDISCCNKCVLEKLNELVEF